MHRKAKALYDFEAKEENEVGFRVGEELTVVDNSDSSWWNGYNADGVRGYFPASFVTFDLAAALPAGSKKDTSGSGANGVVSSEPAASAGRQR